MEAISAPSRGGLALPRSRRLLSALGDEALVAQARRGNDAAFEVIYDRHHRQLLAFCRQMLGSREEAEDALQHTFMSAHRALAADAREISLKSWLYAIARNRCISMLRARRPGPVEPLDGLSTSGLSEEVQHRDDLRRLLGDLSALPAEQRAALTLSELGDLSHAEIASVIGCEASKVRSLVYQARTALIEARRAREMPCEEIREQLATLTGGALRRGHLRRHLRSCPGCTEYRQEVRRQRQMLAAVLPVVPTLGLKESALALAGVKAGAGAVGLTAGGGVVKVAAVAVGIGGATAGGVAVEREMVDRPDRKPVSAPLQPPPARSDSTRAAETAPRAGVGKRAAPGQRNRRASRGQGDAPRRQAGPLRGLGRPAAPPGRIRGAPGRRVRSNGHSAAPRGRALQRPVRRGTQQPPRRGSRQAPARRRQAAPQGRQPVREPRPGAKPLRPEPKRRARPPSEPPPLEPLP